MKSVVTILIVTSLSCGNLANAQLSGIGNNKNDRGVPPQPFFLINNDGGISEISSIPDFQCNYSIAPAVVIENFGSEEMTSATLQYFIDGGSPAYYYWQGSLPPLWTDTIVLPQINVSAGSHTLNILVTEANGDVDINGDNNGSIQFNVVGMSQPAPFEETFDQPVLPNGFFVENPNKGPTWDMISIGSQNAPVNCVRMPFYTNDVIADVDDLYMQNMDLSSVAEAQLNFDVAYAYYSEYYWDKLKVIVSTDCGNAWEVVYDKEKDDLATAPFTDIPFFPSSSQWRSETVDLSAYAGNSNVIIKFEAVSGHGNNLYIDNVGINNNVGIDELAAEKNLLTLYPNPANTTVKVSFQNKGVHGNEVRVLNSLGQQVSAYNILSSDENIIPVDKLPGGTYIVTLNDKNLQLSAAPLIIFH